LDDGLFAQEARVLGNGCSEEQKSRCRAKDFGEAGFGLVSVELLFAEAGFGTGFHGKLLLVRVIGDQHAGNFGELRIGFDLLDDFQAVGVINVELTIDEDKVEGGVSQSGKSDGTVVGLNDVGMEGGFKQPADRSVIRNAVADVENAFSH
jgi:hypothetical protein